MTPLVTGGQIARDLVRLGVSRGSVLMVHTRMSALGHVVGGAQTIVEALLDVLGEDGTLLTLTSWQDMPPYHQDAWPDEERAVYRDHCPPFDPARARADVQMGRVPEAVRTWPGVVHSRHPVSGFSAVGARSQWLMETQTFDEGYGRGSPLDRLVRADGLVLMLGAPLETITLLHLAEYLADAPGKRWIEYEMPVLVDGVREWMRFRELDSDNGAFRYEDLSLDADAFEVIARDALAAGVGVDGTVASAPSHLFPARALIAHAVAWLEARFARSS